MSETMIIVGVVIALLASAMIFAIWFTLRHAPFDTEIGAGEHYQPGGGKPIVFEKNADLKFFHDNRHFLIPRKERTAWLAGVVVTLILTALLSWTSQRDEAARLADQAPRARIDRLDRLIAATRCAAPDAPLEKLVMSIGMEADGNRPTIACVYVTSALGTVPQLRYERPLLTLNDER
mgnify:CR=1 FL=1